jgi:hypothetical protein
MAIAFDDLPEATAAPLSFDDLPAASPVSFDDLPDATAAAPPVESQLSEPSALGAMGALQDVSQKALSLPDVGAQARTGVEEAAKAGDLLSQQTTSGAVARHLRDAILPSAGGAVGVGLGSALAPETFGMSLLFPLIGGLAGSTGTGIAQEKLRSALETGPEHLARINQLSEDEKNHFWATKAADLASALPFFRPDPGQLRLAARGAGYLQLGGKVPAAEKAALQGTLGAFGIGAGQHVAVSAITGQPITFGDVMESGLTIAVLSKPTPLGKALGVPDHGEVVTKMADAADRVVAPATAQALRSTVDTATKQTAPTEPPPVAPTEETHAAEAEFLGKAPEPAAAAAPVATPIDEAAASENARVDGIAGTEHGFKSPRYQITVLDKGSESTIYIPVDAATPEIVKAEIARTKEQMSQPTIDTEAALDAEIAKARAFVTRQPHDAFGGETTPVAAAVINDIGGIVSKSQAKKAGKYERNGELWDEAPSLKHPTHNKVYKASGEMPDAAAQTLYDQGLISDPSVGTMWSALAKESQTARSSAKDTRTQTAEAKTTDSQGTAFEKAAADKTAPAVPVKDLQVGDTVTVGSEPMKVIAIDPDSFDVTLEDGKKFGVQEVKDNAVIYGEHIAGPKAESAFPPLEPKPLPTLRRGENQGDLLSKQTEDLTLVGEKGVDTVRAAEEAARREAESSRARAEAEKLQGRLFDSEAAGIPLSVFEDAMPTLTRIAKEVAFRVEHFADWSKEMIRRVGDAVKPHLAALWKSLIGEGYLPHAKEAGILGLPSIKETLKDIRDIPKFTEFKRAINKVSATMQRTFLESKDIVRRSKETIPDPARREAIGNWIEAKGEAARTGETHQQVLDRWAATNQAKKYQKGYEAAKALTPEEQAFAGKVERFYDSKLALAQKWGVVRDGLDAYVNRIFKQRSGATASGLQGGRLKTNASFSKHRYYQTAFEAEQPALHATTGAKIPGLEHVTKDIGEKMAAYSMELNKVIAQRQLIADLSKTTASDGRPAVFPSGSSRTITKDDKPTAYLTFPRAKAEVVNKISGDKEPAHDYKPIDNAALLQKWKWIGEDENGVPILQQSDLAVHPEFRKHLNKITKGSAVREWMNSEGSPMMQILKTGARGVEKAQNLAKEAMFSFSGFHYVTIGEHVLEHRVNPFGEFGKSIANLATMPIKPLHEMVVRSLNLTHVDYNDPNIVDWTQHALMLAPDHVSAHSFMEGVGGVTGLARIPLIGKAARAISDDLFLRFIPALKVKMADSILKRNLDTYGKELASGKVTVDDVKYLTSQQVNAATSHLNLIDIGRNPTFQHWLRIVILAPDFSESRGRFVGQAAKQLFGGKGGREQFLALAIGGGILYATARVVNQLLNNDAHWAPKDFNAVFYKNRRYEVRSVQGDLMKLATAPNKFAQGRLSPIAKFGLESGSGVNYRGEKASTMDALGELLTSYIPISIREIPGLRDLTATSKNNPVSPLEQFAGAMGVHASRYSPITETYTKAAEFRKKIGKSDKGTYPVSKYQQLRYALEDADTERAKSEYAKLSRELPADKIASGFKASINHPFTGSTADDEKFARTLHGRDRDMYRLALKTREKILLRFDTIKR